MEIFMIITRHSLLSSKSANERFLKSVYVWFDRYITKRLCWWFMSYRRDGKMNRLFIV